MNKTELTKTVAERLDLNKTTVAAVLDAVLDTIRTTVAEEGEVQLVGFGTFRKVHRPERDARNVATGEPIRVPAKDVPAFKPGSEFKATVAGGKQLVNA